MKTKITIKVSLILLIVILFSSTVSIPVASAAPSAAASWCSCLRYFQNNKGLPSTGVANFSAYKYASWLSTHGYNVWYRTPSKTFIGAGQLAGAGFIINPGVLGANSTHGHIGVILDVKYNTSTQKWQIYFKDANSSYPLMSGYSYPRTESNCNNVGYRVINASSLSGVSFFYWSKK